MDENEFKKLTANSRDWEIYKLLSERSKEVIVKDIKSEHISGVNLEDKPTGETSTEEIVKGIVANLTEKAVLIKVGNRVAWFPKSVITNLDKVVLEPNKIAEIIIKEWFKYKIEWKVPTQ